MKSSKIFRALIAHGFGCFWPSFDWILVKVAPTAVDMAQCDAFLTLSSTTLTGTEWLGIGTAWNLSVRLDLWYLCKGIKCRPVGPLLCTGKDNRISAYTVSAWKVWLLSFRALVQVPSGNFGCLRTCWNWLTVGGDRGFNFCWTCTRAWFTWYSTYSTTHVPHILLLLFLCKSY